MKITGSNYINWRNNARNKISCITNAEDEEGVYIRTDNSGVVFASLELLPLVNQVYPYRRTMTFFRDLCDNGSLLSLGYEDSYSLGGLNGYRMGYGGFGGPFGTRGFTGLGGFFGDVYGLGYGYPFFSGFGSRFGY